MKRLITGMLLAVFALTSLLGGVLGSASSALAAPDKSTDAKASTEQAAPAAASAAGNQVITMKDLGDEKGYTLKTVKTHRTYYFTRPANWDISKASAVTVSFQHSSALLPQRSNLNVVLNDRILKTIGLNPGNVTPTVVSVAIPPEQLKDHNTLTFQVDQHYTLECEDPFDASLWTTILPDSRLNLVYSAKRFVPDLSKFPYPFFDELGYGKTAVDFVVPASASSGAFEGMSVIATALGQNIGWRQAGMTLKNSLSQATHNAIIVGTPEENAEIRSLASGLPVKLTGGQFSDPKTGEVLPPDQGVLLMLPNPSVPSRAVLIVSGNGPEGVRNAAHLLVQHPSKNLLVGSYAIVKEYHEGPQHPYRMWDGFLRSTQATFSQLGLETLTARGITALPLFYRLNVMPDMLLPGQTKAKLKTIYSYSSQADLKQSKLEVRLNGKPLKSVSLDKAEGENLAELTLEIPSEEVHTFNELEYQFHLFPEKYDPCRFVTDVHLWGTIHGSSVIDAPAEIRTALPDLGLLNDAGFPFTGYPDFSDVTAVVSKNPSQAELNTLLQAVTRLGRLSKSKAGIRLMVYRPDELPEDVKKADHLIVVGTESNNSFIKDLDGKLSLITSPEETKLKLPEDQKEIMTSLKYNGQQGIVEEMLSPWNKKRVALVLTAETDAGLRKLDRLFESDEMFSKIEPGNLMIVNENSPRNLTVLREGEARFLGKADLMDPATYPLWLTLILGFFVIVGLFGFLRFVFGRN